MSSIYEAILGNDSDILKELLNKNYSLESPDNKSMSCFQFAIKEAEWHQDYSIISTLIDHHRTREKMLITCLQYRIDKKSSYSKMVYRYLFIGCKHNLPNLISFILKNFKVDYLIFQEKDKCLDICQGNDCFQIFLDCPYTREMTLINHIDTFLLPQSKYFIEHPNKDYLYRVFYEACYFRSFILLKYLTDKFIIDLEYNPFPDTNSYFELVSGTPLYNILIDYWYQNTCSKIYTLNKRNFCPEYLSEEVNRERELLKQFDCECL